MRALVVFALTVVIGGALVLGGLWLHGSMIEAPPAAPPPPPWKTALDEATAASSDGRTEVAATRYREALDLAEKHEGPDGAGVAACLTGLGMLDLRDGRLDAAADRLERAVAILDRREGPKAPALLPALSNLANVEIQRGRPAEAVKHLERALGIGQIALPPTSPALGRLADNLERARALATSNPSGSSGSSRTSDPAAPPR